MDSNGDTPLHIGSANGDYSLVMLLCDKGSNPLIKNKLGKSPIDLAKSHEVYQILKVESDKRIIEEEISQVQEKMRKKSKASISLERGSINLDQVIDLTSAKPKYVFKTEKFKRTYERKKGSSMSVAAKK